MTTQALEERIRSSGYTPRAREVPELFELLSGPDEQTVKHAERALTRVGTRAIEVALSRFEASTPPLRSRLVEVIARLARQRPGPELPAWLMARLTDPDPKTRQRAIAALGKLEWTEAEPALLARWQAELPLIERKAIATSLGKMGSRAAAEALRRTEPSDPELARVVREARLLLDRRTNRQVASVIDGTARWDESLPVLLHVRAGLEELLLDELGGRYRARVAGRGRVEVETRGPLSELFRARTFLHLGFPLPPVDVSGDDPGLAVVRSLTSDAAQRVFSSLTRGPVRYRIEWAGAGRSRGRTLRVAEEVSARRPDLVNDPTNATWEAVVSLREGPAGERAVVELWPRAFEDPRFAYRVETVPASSHPTIAAALARIGGVVRDDVVWDPFVGAGLELVERALLGPHRLLIGTDIDARAIGAAGSNLRRAGIANARLSVADAATCEVDPPPTLILTNPPYGKRVSSRESLPRLLEDFLINGARQLRRGGRLVWVSPAPTLTGRIAAARGLRLERALPVDLGGPHGEIQRFSRA